MQQEETIDHFYFACDYTKWIWKEILQRFELNRMPQPNLHQELGDLMQSIGKGYFQMHYLVDVEGKM